MPSPFPGMDPYLESPALWPDVHHELMSVIRRRLNEQLRPRYVVRIEERLYVSSEDDPGRHVLVPDLRISAGDARADKRTGEASVAIAEPIVRTTLIEEEVHEPRLEIIDASTGAVVTVIEILSPANKVPGARGRDSYLQKRHEIMLSSTHLVEIDLLRAGRRIPIEGALPECAYLAHVSRSEQRPQGLLWPIRLSEELPTLPVPLSENDDDAAIELQAVVAETYENAGYDLTIDYGAEPPLPALSTDEAEWVDRLLTTASRR